MPGLVTEPLRLTRRRSLVASQAGTDTARIEYYARAGSAPPRLAAGGLVGADTVTRGETTGHGAPGARALQVTERPRRRGERPAASSGPEASRASAPSFAPPETGKGPDRAPPQGPRGVPEPASGPARQRCGPAVEPGGPAARRQRRPAGNLLHAQTFRRPGPAARSRGCAAAGRANNWGTCSP